MEDNKEEQEAQTTSLITPLRVAMVFGAILIVALGYLRMQEPPVEEMPVYFEIPQFTLTDQDSADFGRDSMEGKIWVADFIFSNCPAICPLLTAKFKALEEQTAKWEGTKGAERIRFLSISVDPRNDTPDVLKKYAEKYKANLDRWTFLTGAPADVAQLLKTGFKVATVEGVSEENVDKVADGEILHVEHFALVDHMGRVRGYYAQDSDSQAKLKRDLRRLLAEVDS